MPPIVQATNIVTTGKFAVYLDGHPGGYWTKVKIPEFKPKTVDIQSAGTVAPTPLPTGTGTYDAMELEQYQDDGGLNLDYFQTWLKQHGDPSTNRATATPEGARRTVRVEELRTDNTVVKTHTFKGCVLEDVGSVDFEAGGDKAVTRPIKIKFASKETR